MEENAVYKISTADDNQGSYSYTFSTSFPSPTFPMQSEQIGELIKALSKAQGKIKNPSKDKINPFFHSKYADLANVWDACRKELSENGLAIIQTIIPDNERIMLVTTLAHTSGQWIRGILPIKPVKNDPQSIGSAITYARRYSLSAIIGIASEEEDDDAEAAMGRGENKPVKKEKPKTPVTGSKKRMATDKQIGKIWSQVNTLHKLTGIDKDVIEKKIKEGAEIEHIKEGYVSSKKATAIIAWMEKQIEKAKEK